MNLEELIAQVTANPAYAGIAPTLVRRVAERELAKGRSGKETVKAVRSKLHQVAGAYQEKGMDFPGWRRELARFTPRAIKCGYAHFLRTGHENPRLHPRAPADPGGILFPGFRQPAPDPLSARPGLRPESAGHPLDAAGGGRQLPGLRYLYGFDGFPGRVYLPPWPERQRLPVRSNRIHPSATCATGHGRSRPCRCWSSSRKTYPAVCWKA